MEHDLRNQWVRALLSGKYQQTQGRLHRGNNIRDDYEPGYCCLGVLCDILPDVESDLDEAFGYHSFKFPTSEESVSSIPMDYRKEIGLDEEDMEVLMTLNDGDADFNTIAMWILRNV